MTGSRRNRTVPILIAALVAVTVVAAYFGTRHAMLCIRTALAEEQMAVFAAMREQALGAEPTVAIDCLRYTVEYYPSGTKQIPGSALDLMVEKYRSEMIRQMIADLRDKTGRDLGDAPEGWIPEYGGDRPGRGESQPADAPARE